MVIPRRLQHKECSSRTGNRRLNVDLDWSGSGNRTRPRPCPQLMPRSAMSFPHSMPSEPNAISNQPINRRAKKPPTAMVAVATLEDRLLPSSANFVPDIYPPMVFMQIQNVEEDDKNAMRAILGNQLYSYGEISPHYHYT
jgi:hypothetical protein